MRTLQQMANARYSSYQHLCIGAKPPCIITFNMMMPSSTCFIPVCKQLNISSSYNIYAYFCKVFGSTGIPYIRGPSNKIKSNPYPIKTHIHTGCNDTGYLHQPGYAHISGLRESQAAMHLGRWRPDYMHLVIHRLFIHDKYHFGVKTCLIS